MSFVLQQWPQTVYPDEADELPSAKMVIDVALKNLAQYGPKPEGYSVKNLGKKKGCLWQLNLKVEKQQIRILFAPYNKTIVVFKIHKKSSPQEQDRAYADAMKRKNYADQVMKKSGQAHDITIH